MRDSQDVQYTLAQPRRQHPTAHVRARRTLFILLAVLLYLPAVTVSIMALISSNHWWGLGAQPMNNASGAWQITWSDRGLSSDFNIQAGDQILAADGQPPQNENQINQTSELTIFSPGDAKAHTVRWSAPDQLATLLSLSWFVLGLVSLLLGLLVFLHATDRVLALRFFLLWTALALASSLVPAASFGNLLAVHISGIVYAGLAPGLLATFLWRLLFPSPAARPISNSNRPLTSGRGGRRSRYRWLPEIPVVIGLISITPYLVAITLKEPDVLERAVVLGSAQTVLALSLSLYLIMRAAISHRVGVTRERARTLLVGMLLGLLPPLALTIIPQVITRQQLVPGTVSDLAIIVLPFSFAYAIVRRELLRLDSLIRNTAVFLLTFIGMGIVAILLAEALRVLPPTPALVIGIITGAVLAPFILAAARWITEAWLFPQVRRYRRLIAQGETIERTGLDPQRIVGQLIGEVHLALPVRQVAVFVPDKTTGHLLEISVPHASARTGEPSTASPSPGSAVALAPSPQTPQPPSALFVDESLSVRLAREGGPLLVEPAPTSTRAGESPQAHAHQGNTSSSITGAIQTELAPPDLDSWHLLTPMRVRGRLVGLLALSRREDDQMYSDTDLRLLRFLAGRRALALDYALLYADLHTAYERRQELDHLKDRFIVTAHHELRTPLTGVQGYLELLRDLGSEGRALRPQEVELFIERACEQTEVLHEQLNSLLVAAETNLTQEQLKPRPVELYTVAQRTIQSMEALAQRGHHRIRNQIPLDLIAIGDEEALYRIFLNLLSNALKYSPEGRPILFDGRTRLIQAPYPSGTSGPIHTNRYPAGAAPVAEMIVRDWGVGIAKSDQDKIFERFTRLERDLNSPVRGSGLGLAICKELIEAMSGTIWVESDGIPGSGSAFFVQLPLAETPVTSKLFAGWEDAPGNITSC
ncbi:MAG TPA: GAF domain-containing sensor histidine kinase [Ktedonobacterales bacterium]|jgi:signal transduction histidine kinase